MNEDFEWIRTHIEELVEKYAGNYIAVVQEEIVSSSSSGVQVRKEARDRFPDQQPFIFRVPREEDFNCLL